MRKVFLEDLPRRNDVNNHIDWKNSIGYKVKFVYDDIKGEFIIISYNKNSRKLTVTHQDKNFEIIVSDFVKCNIYKILNNITSKFKVEIGQRFIDGERDIVIIERRYFPDEKGNNWKYYKYKCNKCGFNGNIPHYNKKGEYQKEHWMLEGNLLTQRNGCACCCTTPQIVVPTINSVFKTDYWMVELGVDKEEAKKYSKGSNKQIKCVCPHCNTNNNKKCSDVYRHKSIGCICSDGISYPEKFVFNILKQLNIEFKTQLSKTTYEWIGNFYYDFCFEYNNELYIIETHGLQHYVSSGRGKSIDEEQENDKIKRELALNNGIEHYIELDCRESELEWIKNNILNSKLNELLDLSQIDWVKAEKLAINSNRVKEVCEFWNNKKDGITTTDLSNITGIDRSVIVRYLKRGVKLGLCNYDAKKEKSESLIRATTNANASTSKKVAIFKKDELLGEFNSCHDLERQSIELFGCFLNFSSIASVCRGKHSQHKGYTFKYID